MTGGDPSIDPVIMFNEPNITKEEAKYDKWVMYSGYGDPKKTRIYYSIDGKRTITYNNTFYDGEKIRWEMISPWEGDIMIKGSDGFSVPPNLESSDLPEIYIKSIARFSPIAYKKTFRKFDMELRDMRIQPKFLESSEENPDNAKYYQKYHGFLNQSYQGFPLFISKSHFLDAESYWA